MIRANPLLVRVVRGSSGSRPGQSGGYSHGQHLGLVRDHPWVIQVNPGQSGARPGIVREGGLDGGGGCRGPEFSIQ